MNKNIVAVLSTTILPVDGTYQVVTLQDSDLTEVKNIIEGIPHYIGHPSTKEIVESFGAVVAPTNLFEGLKSGESAICFSIRQGMSSRKTEGKTVDQDITLDMLSIRLITKISAPAWKCAFCGTINYGGYLCGQCGAS